jgi:superfamily II DNA/RNA helicase
LEEKRGCLSILPAANTFDGTTFKSALKISSEWSADATEIFENFTKNAKSLQFIESFATQSIVLGDVEAVNVAGDTISVSKVLIDHRLALEHENVLEELKQLQLVATDGDSRIPRSNSNFGKIFEKVMKPLEANRTLPNSNQTLPEVVQIKSPSDSGSLQLFSRAAAEMKPLKRVKDLAKIFIHGEKLQEPIDQIEEALFTEGVHRSLEALNFRTIFRLQLHSWPNLFSGRSMFIVNGDNSGKTFSYLPALLSLIVGDKDENEPWVAGPVGIIVAKSSSAVESIFKCSKKLVDSSFRIVKATGKFNCDNKKVELMNMVELLITTPECFSRLAVDYLWPCFDKKRIKHLVFDGIHEMDDVELLKTIVATCTNGEKHQELNPQIVVTSTSWNSKIRQLMKLSRDPIVLIGSFAEAAIYANCQFTVVKDSADAKLQRLQQILSDKKWRTKRTLVVFNHQNELEYIRSMLSGQSDDFLVIDGEMRQEMKERTKLAWQKETAGKMKFLLATDFSLIDCDFKSVQQLIHYSLPDKWSTFSARFALMGDVFMKFLSGDTENGQTGTVVMLDSNNAKEIPQLIKFVKDRGVVKRVSSEIEELVAVRS